MPKPIDIDDPTSWPTEIYKAASRWAEECSGKTEYTNDLPLSLELEAPFRYQLAGHLLRGYHYTRLLPHERELVLLQGLRMLSAELLTGRIEAARKIGIISSSEAKTFHAAHVFAVGEQGNRENRVCLTLSKRMFERDPDDCLPFLANWGGEGLYRSSGCVPFRDRLRSIGVPTRVVALIEPQDAVRDSCFPALHKQFVGSLLRLHDIGGEIHYRTKIPPEHIERVEQIGLPQAR